MSEQALTSLAILTVNWDRGHDTIESFVPLVAECIRRNGAEPISAVELQDRVKDVFGLKIPLGALQVIVGRCQTRGYVQRKHNAYYPIKKKLAELDFGPNQAEALRQHACLLDKLSAFAKDRYDLDWSEEEADDALLGYLHESSIPVLLAATEGDPLPRTTRHSRRTRHVMSAFAGHLGDNDRDGFECLETVVKGHVLSTVLFYPDLGQVQAKFQNLDIYCDTPFLLPAIGYAEEGRRLQCTELMDLLTELGANLKCFHHTEEEVAGVLEAEAAHLRGKAVEPTEYFTSRAFRLAEVEELIISLPQTLKKLHAEVVDTPEWREKPDEAALDEAIESEVHYFREKAREKDVRSLAAVYRLRNGRRMAQFETSRAIFLTTNTTLVRASSSYFRDIESGGAIPVCMSVSVMSRLAWVKQPLAAPDLPQHLVRASAYAALNPSNALWRAYLEELGRRLEQGKITDEHYHFLRSSREARLALMDITLGDEEAFTAGTLDEIEEYVREQIQKEAKAEAQSERAEKEAAQQEARIAEETAAGLDRIHRDEADRKSKREGLIAAWLIGVVLIGTVLLGAVATFPGIPLLDFKSVPGRIVIWICIGVFVALTLYAAIVKDVSVFDIRRGLAARIENNRRARRHRKLDTLHARATQSSRRE